MPEVETILQKYESNFPCKISKQRESGADIADILIKLDWQQFRKEPPPPELNLISLPNIDNAEVEQFHCIKFNRE